MADTFTPVSGYLAGIYRSLGTVVGAVEKHQLLVDGDFATGALLPNWTDDSAGGASTAVLLLLKGGTSVRSGWCWMTMVQTLLAFLRLLSLTTRLPSLKP